tara:strand:+ start:1027 stop:1518 length:492 start_codon:yes stop_codon:yes gene_type:complete
VDINELVSYYNNFPCKGINYIDIQPLLEDNLKYNYVIEQMGCLVKTPDFWVGVESRGFLFASALSIKFGGGVKLIRKKGKLPGDNLVSVDYSLEYGIDSIQIEKTNVKSNIVIVDDIFATGGTLIASEKLCELANFNVTDLLTFVDIGISKENNPKLKSLYRL